MHEPRNAKEQIEKAFLDLLEEKPYMDITVTDIVKKADVARVTYYPVSYTHLTLPTSNHV